MQGEQVVAAHSPVPPKGIPSLGLPAPCPKRLPALVAPRHGAGLCQATILSTLLSGSHFSFYHFRGHLHNKLPKDTVFP